jgi:hypothetical protein
MESQHLKRINDLSEEHRAKLETEAKNFNRLLQQKMIAEKEFESTRKYLEEFNDVGLEVIREENTVEVKNIQDTNKQSKSDLIVKRKQHEEKKNTVEKCKENIKIH